MSDLKYGVFQTKLGWVAAVVSPAGLRRLTAPEPTPDAAEQRLGYELDGVESDEAAVDWVRQRVCAYLSGEDSDLATIPLDLVDAPPFYRRAWEACRSIPAGETRSYRWLAAAAGNPLASRAAGQAMARNRLALVVPCHRVVASDGTPHGFNSSSGVEMKRRLLALEARGK